MQHRTLIALAAVLIAASLPMPGHASEVVKLARLVLTGKRVGAEPQHREPTPTAADKSAPTPIAGVIGGVAPDATVGTSVEPSSSPGVGASTGCAAHGQAFLRPF